MIFVRTADRSAKNLPSGMGKSAFLRRKTIPATDIVPSVTENLPVTFLTETDTAPSDLPVPDSVGTRSLPGKGNGSVLNGRLRAWVAEAVAWKGKNAATTTDTAVPSPESRNTERTLTTKIGHSVLRTAAFTKTADIGAPPDGTKTDIAGMNLPSVPADPSATIRSTKTFTTLPTISLPSTWTRKKTCIVSADAENKRTSL